MGLLSPQHPLTPHVRCLEAFMPRSVAIFCLGGACDVPCYPLGEPPPLPERGDRCPLHALAGRHDDVKERGA
jgi:hypothetical protein